MFLSSLVKYWPALVAVLFGTVMIYLGYYIGSHAVQAKWDKARSEAQQAAIIQDQIQKEALAAERTQAAQNYQQANTLKQQVNHAKQSDDGAVAPVLSNILLQLQQPTGHNTD